MSASRARLQRIAQSMGKFHKPKPQLREAAKKTKWNILRGDKVQVIGNHPERGKQGSLRYTACLLRSRNAIEVIEFSCAMLMTYIYPMLQELSKLF